MKIFHTADWHLGKLVQGVYMTEDQEYILNQFIDQIKEEKPDAVIIAGDLYDRAVPPTEAVNLLDRVLENIIIELNTPVIAVAGNHDSPGRLNFGSNLMKKHGYFIKGQLSKELEPVVLTDEFGEVHFHLIPYADPSIVRDVFEDENVRTHNDAMKKITEHIVDNYDQDARHVLVGHAFVTPYGENQENTSDSERPLSIGGAEYVSAEHFKHFNYTALGHLHKAHYVLSENIRYSGSLLKYSISEEIHKKGFNIIELDGSGQIKVERKLLKPIRDMRTVEGTMKELLLHSYNEDYVFVRLLDESAVLTPMEKIRSVYPNAMHVERKIPKVNSDVNSHQTAERHKLSDIDLFKAFYEEVMGTSVTEKTEEIFVNVLQELLIEQNEHKKIEKKSVKI